MKKALVYIDAKDGALKKSTQELLSLFDGSSDYEIHGVAIGDNVKNLAGSLGAWSVAKLHCAEDGSLANYNPELYRMALAQAFETIKPDLVLGSSNMLCRDVFPRLAAQFDCAYMSDITEITLGADFSVRRPMFSGKCSAEVCFTDESCKILLVRPNQIPVVEANGSATTEVVALETPASTGRTELQSVEKGESEKLDLTEANVIVSGGRGLKEAENFKLLEQLAEPISGTVGASRAVVDLGWVPHSMQVGQTGKTVAPTLYIAAGISGAIQHLAGMSGSKIVVAINKDEKAPIFQKATYGIVGDLFEVVPQLTEKLQAVKS